MNYKPQSILLVIPHNLLPMPDDLIEQLHAKNDEICQIIRREQDFVESNKKLIAQMEQELLQEKAKLTASQSSWIGRWTSWIGDKGLLARLFLRFHPFKRAHVEQRCLKHHIASSTASLVNMKETLKYIECDLMNNMKIEEDLKSKCV